MHCTCSQIFKLQVIEDADEHDVTKGRQADS